MYVGWRLCEPRIFLENPHRGKEQLLICVVTIAVTLAYNRPLDWRGNRHARQAGLCPFALGAIALGAIALGAMSMKACILINSYFDNCDATRWATAVIIV